MSKKSEAPGDEDEELGEEDGQEDTENGNKVWVSKYHQKHQELNCKWKLKHYLHCGVECRICGGKFELPNDFSRHWSFHRACLRWWHWTHFMIKMKGAELLLTL